MVTVEQHRAILKGLTHRHISYGNLKKILNLPKTLVYHRIPVAEPMGSIGIADTHPV